VTVKTCLIGLGIMNHRIVSFDKGTMGQINICDSWLDICNNWLDISDTVAIGTFPDNFLLETIGTAL
jgi:hypothetical protein